MYFEGTPTARALLEEAQRQGVPPERVLGEAGLDASLIDPPALHIPWAAARSLIGTAVRLTRDAAFGAHAGANMDFRHIDIAGPYALNQPAIRDGMRITWGEVQPLMTNVIRSELREEQDRASLRLECALEDSDESAHLIEFYLMAHVACCRLIDGTKWAPRAVHFRHGPPEDSAEQRRLFGCAPEYGRQASEVFFDRAFLDRPFPLADPGLLETIRPRYEAYLDTLHRGQAVTLWLRNTLSLMMDEHDALELNAAARRMRIRPRTLQHKLAAEGTSFHAVRDALRRDAALADLNSRDASLEAVAAKLKYSDASALLRAFRRWTGETPGRWRERQRAGG